MLKGSTVKIPDVAISRQAVDCVRGYAFQLYVTAQAWIRLSRNEQLLVEVADDYAVAADQALRTVQVKHDNSKSATLRSPGVVATLNNLWDLQQANSELVVHATYLTTTQIGREQGLWFPSQKPGLVHWANAATTLCDLSALREALNPSYSASRRSFPSFFLGMIADARPLCV